SLRPDGFYVYTNGQHLIHAAGHATADAQGQPVQFPVTPDSPGKFAAHHVLVENQGGFAISNQPYRMTLDDGRVISGVTNELGEMELVTSNATMFGMIELMSQSEPDHVVGLVSTTVYQDASLPPPNAVAPAQTMQVGNKTVSTPQTGATSQAREPAFLSCDPMNFGLRTYRFIGSAKADISIGLSRKDVEYPVAKAYTAAVKKTLTAIDWKGVRSASSTLLAEQITIAVKDALTAALQSGAFGMPKSAMPDLEILTRESAKVSGFNLRGTEAAVFNATAWTMHITEATISILLNQFDMIDAAKTDAKRASARGSFDARLRGLATTIYHEARHCQQRFWMMSLYGTYPDDYKQFPGIAAMFKTTTQEDILTLAEKQQFPRNDLVKIGVHRMLIFQYWWFIVVNREAGVGYEPWKPAFADADKVQAEVAKMRGVTLEQALAMGQRDEPGYYTHYHEEDAFATEIAVMQYWDNPDHADLVNPGTCTRHYRHALEAIGVFGNG
ncbi:type VI secretion system tip protein VgrG, partial [Paraburkholderia tropica]